MNELFASSLVDAISAFFGVQDLGSIPESRMSPENLVSFQTALGQLAERPIEPGGGPIGIAKIRERDPQFSLREFLLRVGQMFSAYHEAFDRGDLAPVRRFVDESYWAQLAEASRKAGRQPAVRSLRVKAIRPYTATSDDGLDVVRVLITAEQNSAPEPICEYWELIRKAGARSQPGLDITKCPNCGGPVDGDDPTRCAYCGTRFADPAYDWVVRKITEQ